MPESNMKELGALWKKESKGGEKYLTGVVNLKGIGLIDQDVNLVIFSNKQKKKDTHPDLRIYFSEPRNGGTSKPAKTAVSKPAKTADQNPPATDDAGLL